MNISFSGLCRDLRVMVDDLQQRVDDGDPIDDDWIMEHQPRAEVFGVDEILRNLRLVAADPTRLAEFFEFVGIRFDPKTTSPTVPPATEGIRHELPAPDPTLPLLDAETAAAGLALIPQQAWECVGPVRPGYSRPVQTVRPWQPGGNTVGHADVGEMAPAFALLPRALKTVLALHAKIDNLNAKLEGWADPDGEICWECRGVERAMDGKQAVGSSALGERVHDELKRLRAYGAEREQAYSVLFNCLPDEIRNNVLRNEPCPNPIDPSEAASEIQRLRDYGQGREQARNDLFDCLPFEIRRDVERCSGCDRYRLRSKPCPRGCHMGMCSTDSKKSS